jgi:hypothetical protein
MSEETTDKSGKTWPYVAGLLVGMPLLYALSIGPVFVLVMKKAVSNDVLLIYSPLERFMQATGTDDAFKAYVSAGLYLTGTPIP